MYASSYKEKTKTEISLYKELFNLADSLNAGEEFTYGLYRVFYDGEGYYLFENEDIICFNFKLKEAVILVLILLGNDTNIKMKNNTIDQIFKLYEKYEYKLFECELNLERIDKYHKESDLEMMEIEHCKFTENKSKRNAYHKFILDMVRNIKKMRIDT